MGESEIRSVLGAPDPVVVGAEEYQHFVSTHKLGPTGLGSGDYGYKPILHRGTRGVYFYKVGRIAKISGLINHTALAIEFNLDEGVTDHYDLAVGPNSDLADLFTDTRSARLIRNPN